MACTYRSNGFPKADVEASINGEPKEHYLHLLVTFEQLIEEYLIPSHILANMPTMREFAADIRNLERRNRKEAVKTFLDLLKDCNQRGWYREFIRALEENDFEMIVNALKGFGDVQDQEVYKLLLTSFYEKLVRVRPDNIIPFLIARSALNVNDQEIITKCENTQSAMITLLDILSKKKESWFNDLIHALHEGGWEELAEEIIPEINKIKDIDKAIENVVQAQGHPGTGSSLNHVTNIHQTGSMSNQIDCDEGTLGHELRFDSVPTETALESPIPPTSLHSAALKQMSPSPGTIEQNNDTKEAAHASMAFPEFPQENTVKKTNSMVMAVVAPSNRKDSLNAAVNALDLKEDNANLENNNTDNQEESLSIANQNVEMTVTQAANDNRSNIMATPLHVDQSEAAGGSSGSHNELSPNQMGTEQSKQPLYEKKELNIPFTLHSTVPEDSDVQSNADNTGGNTASPEHEKLKLRGYQLELAETAVDGKNVIVEAPTGSGKTHVAMHITEKHFENADLADEPKVIFLVPTVALVTQQLTEFKKYLSHQKCLGLSGESDRVAINEQLPEYQIVVLTPVILLDAIKTENVTLSQLTLLIFDECHHTTKGHPYNDIMAIYIEQKLSEDNQSPLPQVVGLTASVGVGKSTTQIKAQDHILRLMANLDSERLCTVNNPINKVELRRHVNRPDEETLEVHGRKTDPFNKSINILMENIERKMKTSPALVQANSEVAGFQTLLEAPPNRGTEQYIQWLSRLDRPIATIHLQTTRRLFFACHNHLKAYNNALLINSDCRTKDALEYLYKEFKELKISQSDETDKWLEQIFTEKEPILKLFSEDPTYDNPKLDAIREKLLKVFQAKPDSRAIIFVKTREMTKALVNWMKETPELAYLNGFSLTGSQAASTKGGMTQNKQDDVVKYFREGKHKVIVATSVAEEGLDIRKCNLVMRYEHVTNEIAMVQTRGRGRDDDSEYCVIGEKGGGIAEREMTNKIKESMMTKAVQEIQIFQENREKMKPLLLKYQMEARLERQMKALGKQTEKEIKEARQLRGEYQLRCLKCDALAAFSSDFRKIEQSHHVVLDPAFEDRVKVEPHHKPTEYGNFEKTGKLYCKKCNYDWGISALYRKARFSVLKLVSFVLVDPRDSRNTYKKWKDAPFHVNDLSPEDLSERLQLMVNMQAQSSED